MNIKSRCCEFSKKFEQLYRRLRCRLSTLDQSCYQRILGCHPFYENHVSERPLVLFHFRKLDIDIDGGRYAYLLIKDFLASDFRILITDRYEFLATFGRKPYKNLIEDEPFELVDKENLPAQLHTIVSDSPYFLSEVQKTQSEANSILVNYEHRAPQNEDEITMPYLPYPKLLDKGLCHQAVATSPLHPRPIKICFAGRVCPRTHNRAILSEVFNMMNRYEIISQTSSHLIDQTLYLRSSHFAADSLPVAAFAQPHKNLLLQAHQYVRLLSESNFFVAPPGGVFPLSHNLSEAMLMGCIPILPYAHYPIPKLTPGTNCLSYHDKSSLTQALDQALAMPPEQVLQMRENAHHYAKEHLELGSFSQRFRTLSAASKTLKIFYFQSPRKRSNAP